MFKEFFVERGGKNPMPKGVCSLSVSKSKRDHWYICVSAPDALNGLRATNYVRPLFDAATSRIGIKRVSDARGACKIQRDKKSSACRITLPASLCAELKDINATPGRYYFMEDPSVGFYVIDLTRPAQTTVEAD